MRKEREIHDEKKNDDYDGDNNDPIFRHIYSIPYRQSLKRRGGAHRIGRGKHRNRDTDAGSRAIGIKACRLGVGNAGTKEKYKA